MRVILPFAALPLPRPAPVRDEAPAARCAADACPSVPGGAAQSSASR